jgi:branched-subunit amino acid aminotransferase/4-amino-4-deoxychorismate lyase
VGQVEERHSTWKDIQERSPFLVNSVRGVVRISSVQGDPVSSASATDALAARFWP